MPRRGLPLLLVAFLVGSGCGSNSGPSPNATVVKATDLGAIPTNPDILGRDGAYSTFFHGYSVWLYGDTFLAKPNAEDRTLISDSWSYTTELNAADGIMGFRDRLDPEGAPAMILTETPTEKAFNQAHSGNPGQQPPCGARWALWPSSIVTDPASNHALVFYMVVFAQPGTLNFQPGRVRCAVARFSATTTTADTYPSDRGETPRPHVHWERAQLRHCGIHQQRHALRVWMRNTRQRQ